MILKSTIANDVIKGAQYFPVIAILGPRQSGKTTLAQEIFKKHNYVTLEDIDIRNAAIKDPRTFLLTNSNESGIILDEFQHAPELLSYIQTISDREQKPGFFILIGSQNFLMNQAISQSLAGRIAIYTLLPLSIHELSQNQILPTEIESMLYQGSYPAIYAKNIPADLLYRNYFQTYVERDVRQLTQVGDLTTFQTFITLCAGRIGQLLNLTSLGNECGISDQTVKRWLSILEASYIIFLLRPYYNSFGKRLVKTPKIYFYDTGLACFLLKIKQDELATHPNKGSLFESFIISDFLKQFYNHGQLPNLYFWRDKTGNEIDCIIDQGKELIAIEVKSGRTINKRFFEGINYLQNLTTDTSIKTLNGYVVFAGSTKQIRPYSNLISWQELYLILQNIK